MNTLMLTSWLDWLAGLVWLVPVLPLLAGAASSLVGVAPLFWCSGIASFAGAWFYRGLWRSRPPLKPKAP